MVLSNWINETFLVILFVVSLSFEIHGKMAVSDCSITSHTVYFYTRQSDACVNPDTN